MKIEEIEREWSSDCRVDKTELSSESLNIPVLHNKYLKILVSENLLLAKLKLNHQILERDKFEYYTGKMCEEDLEEHGWEPFPHKLLKQDIPQYILGDGDIISALLKMAEQKEKVEFLREILRSINTRSFNIGNAIKWEQFINGINIA
jgi:hypothetical protein